MGLEKLLERCRVGERIVTAAFKRKRENYKANDWIAVRDGISTTDVCDFLLEADYVFNDYDDSKMDVPALQSVFEFYINNAYKMFNPFSKRGRKMWRWGLNTAYSCLKMGIEELRSEGAGSKINRFKIGAKRAQSVAWFAFVHDFVGLEPEKAQSLYTLAWQQRIFGYLHDLDAGNSSVDHGKADSFKWSRERAEQLVYPGSQEFYSVLLARNETARFVVETRDIQEIVEPGLDALGIPDDRLQASYAVFDKARDVQDKVNDLQKGQKVVYFWDSDEDLVCIDYLKEKVGEKNVLTVKIVANKDEIDGRSDVYIQKNYSALASLVRQDVVFTYKRDKGRKKIKYVLPT